MLDDLVFHYAIGNRAYYVHGYDDLKRHLHNGKKTIYTDSEQVAFLLRGMLLVDNWDIQVELLPNDSIVPHIDVLEHPHSLLVKEPSTWNQEKK